MRFFKVVISIHAFLALGLVLTRCTFSNYAKKSYERAKKEKPYDVIIVPGMPYDKTNVSSSAKIRMFWAKHLYDSGFTNNIIFSGAAVYTPFVEGIAMKAMGDSLGISSAHTFSETKAEHSTENVYYSWKMAKALGFKKIALATDPFQAAMLRSFIRRYCPDVKSVPAVSGTFDINKALPDIDTTVAYVSNFKSIKERESFWQRFKGTMGKRIKEERKAEALNEKEKKSLE